MPSLQSANDRNIFIPVIGGIAPPIFIVVVQECRGQRFHARERPRALGVHEAMQTNHLVISRIVTLISSCREPNSEPTASQSAFMTFILSL